MMFGIQPFNFMRKKNLLLIGICFIFLVGFLFFNIDFEKKSEIPIYPFKISAWENLLASVSQIFNLAPIKKIEVDLTKQKLKILEGEKIIAEFLVSTGSKEAPTPIGKFKVKSKKVMVYSKIANCWLPFWVGFTSDGLYGFHEVPICQEGRKGLEYLGKPASIGCVRLGIKDSETLYKWAEIGTPVIIYGSTP